MTAFGILALVLAAIGIYGLMTYLAGERAREISIRMAIGANGGAIRAMVLRQTLALTVAGILIGVAAALALTRLMQGVLFEVGTLDPLSFAAAVVVLAGAAFVAGYVPAWRASRLDPVSALRL